MANEHIKHEQFLDRMSAVLSTKRSVVEAILSITSNQSVRVNTLKEDVALYPQVLNDKGWQVQPFPWIDHAWNILSEKEEVSHDELVTLGKLYIQNASSFIPSLLLNPQPGERVLDVAAAPGGKSAHLAALAQGQAELWVNDNDIERIRSMKRIFETLSVKPFIILNQNGQHLHETLTVSFDKILLDAPCSAESYIRVNEEQTYSPWSTKRIRTSAELQKRLLRSAFQLLKPGGLLVYSTCTYAPEENEMVVADLLQQSMDAKLVDISLAIPNRMDGITSWQGEALDPSLAKTMRILPTESMEGFYTALITKSTSV